MTHDIARAIMAQISAAEHHERSKLPSYRWSYGENVQWRLHNQKLSAHFYHEARRLMGIEP